jgi:hypothetical protein
LPWPLPVVRRLAAAVLVVGLLLATEGCTTASGPGGGKSRASAILPDRSAAELRKKVEADHFPTAEQAGVK